MDNAKDDRMKVTAFSTHCFEKPFLEMANKNYHHKLGYFDIQLSPKTAVLAKDFPVISCFVTDKLNAEALQLIADNGTKLIYQCKSFRQINYMESIP